MKQMDYSLDLGEGKRATGSFGLSMVRQSGIVVRLLSITITGVTAEELDFFDIARKVLKEITENVISEYEKDLDWLRFKTILYIKKEELKD